MSNRCPVCKAPLWKEHLLLRKLRCPRCGAEFRTAVPWVYFQFLLLVVALLSLTVLVTFFHNNIWLLLLFALFLGFFLIYLSWIVDIKLIPGDFRIADGPREEEKLQLKLKYPGDEDRDPAVKQSWFRWAPLFLALMILGLVLFAFLVR